MIRRIREHREKIKRHPKRFIIIILVLLLLLILMVTPLRDKAVFSIEDKCGKFINLFSHTIDDEVKCRTRCRSQCSALGYNYKKAQFTESKDSCNICICHCG